MIERIEARRLIGARALVEYPVVEVEDGRILSIGSRESVENGHGRHFSFPEATLAPSYFDVHIHGAAGHDVMEGTAESLETVERFLLHHGVGAFLPTTVTSPMDQTLHAVERIAEEIERGGSSQGASPLGIHLEGPFLSTAKPGVHPTSCILEPSIPQFDKLWEAARGHIRLMTIAPEMPHALELIKHAVQLGVRCSLGHSNATFQEAEAGFLAGASTATHTFNAMRSLKQRDPGIAGFVLDREELFADVICDGFHVDPAFIRLFFKAKGEDRAILITDALAPAGMPAGNYRVGSLEVQVEGGHCVSGGVIAGSIVTLDQAVRNFLCFTGCNLAVAARMAARNPAQMTGFDDCCGVLEEGRDANLNVLSAQGDLLQVFRKGEALLAV